ncbi:hypothetical protein [Actinoplanes sp. GCM10030250]|uniref:hypothetical protein n=1 Tax=Actinoplanes sp. GCM10030250 TaxID=3273376 RepID=UPI00360E4105
MAYAIDLPHPRRVRAPGVSSTTDDFAGPFHRNGGGMGGKTYAELPRDDPNRDSVMTASFLQASLFTSVVAFGVAVLAAGLGIVLVLIGSALRRLARVAESAGIPSAGRT